jgi:hypothetical protein
MSFDYQDTSGIQGAETETTLPFVQLIKVGALAAEALLVGLAWSGSSLMLVLPGHGAVLVALLTVLVLVERSGLDSSDLQRFSLLTLCGGPIGALSAFVNNYLETRLRAPNLDQWYETIAPSQRQAVTLFDRIVDDRLVRRDARLPRRFEALLTQGTMQEKQGLLAYLAADGDLAKDSDALSMALRSSDQLVRVQAAAVAAYARSRARQKEIVLLPGAMASRSERYSPAGQSAPTRAGVH